MTPNISQIHDKFFKEAFSRLDVLTDFIKAYLPEDFSSQLDFDSITRKQDSHIDDELAQHYVDLLFEARLGQKPITIALLLEHKSYAEEYPHLQLNRYLLNYWADQLKAKQSLQPVIPILIYHGRGKWKYRPMRAYFSEINDQLAQFLPDFRYFLINLTNDPQDRFSLLTSNYAKLTAGLLRTIRQKQRLREMLTDLSDAIAQLAEETMGEQFIKTSLLYISQGGGLTHIEIMAIFTEISRKTEQIVMSAYESLIQEGLQKGMQEASLQFIRGLLKLNMDAQTIATVSELPLATVQQYIEFIKKEAKL